MKQIAQKLKDGKMQITEVPVPDLRPGMILVRNFYSLISAGTESSTVKAARKGYMGKARERLRDWGIEGLNQIIKFRDCEFRD